MHNCTCIILCIIGDLLHNWTKCTQFSDLHIIHQILSYSLIHRDQLLAVVMWNAAFLSKIINYWHLNQSLVSSSLILCILVAFVTVV